MSGRGLVRRFGVGVLVLLLALAAMSLQKPGRYAAAAAAPEVKSFHLYATDGYMTLPDGATIYIWGYSLKNEPGSAVFTSPTLEVNEGDIVEVTLTNIGAKKKGIKRVAHTIHWHGLDTDQQNDGVPHTSAPIQQGESFTYRFTATHAGTYFYHCHVDTIEHLQMGMYGALVVKAKGGEMRAWTGGPAYDKDYVLLLNEIDPVWHKAVEEGKPYDRTDFHPAYWTMNGKAFPDTESDPSTMIEGKVGESVLIRIINAGYQPHSFHMHGFHFQVIASDGRPLPEPLLKDTLLIGSGERYDILVKFDQSGMFPLHSHNIVDNTNNGVYPGGLHTMIDVKEAGDGGGENGMMMTLTMKAGQAAVTVNGEKLTLSHPPVKLGGVTYVPLRFIGEQLGAKVEWRQQEQSVVYTTESGGKIQLWVNGKQALAGTKLLPLNAPPKIVDGAVLVPLRFVADQLGASVDYNAATGVIVVKGTMSMPDAGGSGSEGTGSAGGHAGHGGSGAGAGNGGGNGAGGTGGSGGTGAGGGGAGDGGGGTGGTGNGAIGDGTGGPGGSGSSGEGTGGSGGGNGGSAGGSPGTGGTGSGTGDPLKVSITGAAFVPAKLTVKKGQTVTWTNADTQIHTVFDLNDAFTSGNILSKAQFQVTFQEPGTYIYYCSIHPSMTGEITVTE
ncbi:stalk domain-containing protein [Paenibacillus silvisoli]|uniref:stalk domain-containing protein n=1 Tax=Paenibacillus silvisoli TaxID=3110539 RepID=UPI0028055B42|nr:stalk domain-containing protein [Paenibacillus silvisoli]